MGVYCKGELIRQYRQSCGLSQEELSEGICSVQTLSRIENGRQDGSKRLYHCLMERLAKETESIYLRIEEADGRLDKYIREYGKGIRYWDGKNAEKALKQLEGFTDLTRIGKQAILAAKAILSMKLGHITPGAARQMLWEALEYTVERPLQKDLGSYPWLDPESGIWCKAAETYCEENEFAQAIHILKSLHKNIKRGYRIPEKGRTLELIVLGSLTEAYGKKGEHKRAMAYAKRGIELCRKEKSSEFLILMLWRMEWNMEKLLEKGEDVLFTENDCLNMLRKNICLAEAIGKKREKKLLEKHKKEYYRL